MYINIISCANFSEIVLKYFMCVQLENNDLLVRSLVKLDF